MSVAHQYFLDVILPLPLERIFTYAITNAEADFIKPGVRVSVPFGKNKIYTSIALKLHAEAPTAYEVKSIHSILDKSPIVNEYQIQLWQWISEYYMASLGDVLRAALPSAFLLESETEKVIFDKVSTGALSDLEKVTKQARAMVTVYGLSDKVGNLTYYDSSGQNEYGFTKPYSEQTAELIDKEISDIIEKQYQRAVELLKKHKDKLVELAEVLLKDEVIFKDNLETIFGKRPFEVSETEISTEQSQEEE